MPVTIKGKKLKVDFEVEECDTVENLVNAKVTEKLAGVMQSMRKEVEDILKPMRKTSGSSGSTKAHDPESSADSSDAEKSAAAEGDTPHDLPALLRQEQHAATKLDAEETDTSEPHAERTAEHRQQHAEQGREREPLGDDTVHRLYPRRHPGAPRLLVIGGTAICAAMGGYKARGGIIRLVGNQSSA